VVASGADPGRELATKYSLWWVAVARAVGFELAGALTADAVDAESTESVRRQHLQNGAILRRLVWPSLN
jgi:hypothetical protein